MESFMYVIHYVLHCPYDKLQHPGAIILVARIRSDFARQTKNIWFFIKALEPTERVVKNKVQNRNSYRVVVQKNKNYHRVQNEITIRLILILIGKYDV